MMCVKRFLILVIIYFGIMWPSAAFSQTPAQDSETEQSINDDFAALDDPDFVFNMPPEFQTELPQDKARAAPKPKPRNDPLFNLGFLGPIFQVIFYGLLALAVGFILYLIINAIIAARRSHVKADKTEDVPDIPVYQPDAKAAQVLLDDADALAAQGKYAEAVHILLYRSIQDIEKSRPHHVKRSLTSREIAGLSILSPKAKDVFSQIGTLVENSYFGGNPLGAIDYETSKDAYKTFAFENVGTAKARKKPPRSRR